MTKYVVIKEEIFTLVRNRSDGAAPMAMMDNVSHNFYDYGRRQLCDEQTEHIGAIGQTATCHDCGRHRHMARECSYKGRGKVAEEFLASMDKGTLPV